MACTLYIVRGCSNSVFQDGVIFGFGLVIGCNTAANSELKWSLKLSQYHRVINERIDEDNVPWALNQHLCV